MSTWEILAGDCRVRLAEMDENSVDAIVTDPPYELNFMGKKWDRTGIAYDAAMWRLVLRVLKPGGHLLAFGGTRTYHRMTCAIEDAGFEIRDSIHWIYGSGFPKSLDISKAIDKAAGAEREVVGESARHVSGKPEQRTEGLNGSSAFRESIGMGAYITAPATDAAKQWAGYGTALKPGHEPIVLARKPLLRTVAINVLEFGTGGLNIDGCRIESIDPLVRPEIKRENNTVLGAGLGAGTQTEPAGRWPANVIFSHSTNCVFADEQTDAESRTFFCAPDCPVRELDAQSGIRPVSGAARNGRPATAVNEGMFAAGSMSGNGSLHNDSGGASRFFYVAKPSRAERDRGLEHLPMVRRTDGRKTEHQVPNLRTSARRNHHPTVKPIALMRHLVRLITPPNGLVLDPFAGSGTTGIAALQEGFRFIGIDLDPESQELARNRIAEDAPLFNRKNGG